MPKLLISGLAMSNYRGKDSSCTLCNYNLTWLITNPSTLLWAEKLVLTPHLRKILSEKESKSYDKYFSSATNVLFDILDDSKLIEIKDPNKIIDNKTQKNIDIQINRDVKSLIKKYPKIIQKGDDKKVPGQLFVDKSEFCYPRLYSIYVGMFLSQMWKSKCLFNYSDYDYLNRKFSIKLKDNKYIDTFNEVFKVCLPEFSLLPSITYSHDDYCMKCENINKCESSYLKDIEKNTYKILKYREYDEIHQLRSIIEKSILDYSNTDIEPQQIVSSIRQKQLRLNKLIKGVFPKIDRWSHLITVGSIPLAVIGLATQNPLLTIPGASFAGIAQMTSKMIKMLESKNKWIGFMNSGTRNKPI